MQRTERAPRPSCSRSWRCSWPPAARHDESTTSRRPRPPRRAPRRPTPRPRARPRPSGEPSATPVPTAAPGQRLEAKPGDVVVRWFCCLGTGDAPEQVAVEQQGRRRLQRLAPGHPPALRGLHLRRARATRCRSSSARATARTSSARSASAAPTPSTASGSTCSRSSTRTSFDMTQLPEVHGRPLQRRRRGPGRHPVRDLPVGAVLQGRACSRKPASTSRRTTWNGDLHDARRLDRPVGLRHRPQARAAADRRQERQGRDRGRLRSREDRPVGLRAAARRPAPDRRVLEGRQLRRPPTARPSRSRTPGPRPGSAFYDGIWKDHISGRPGRSSRHRLQPERLPVLHRQGRDERELPLVDCTASPTPATTGTWRRPRPTRARRRRRSTPTRSASSSRRKHPDAAFTVLPVPARQPGPAQALRRHAGGRVRSRTPSCRRLQADYTQTIDWNVAKEGVNLRRRAELRVVHARPTTRPST